MKLLMRADPAALGVHPQGILDLVDRLDALHCHALIVTRHGKVIAEGYWAPFRPEFEHIQYSVSKSFVSAAVGFAADEGLLSLDDRILDHFPEVLPSPPCENMQRVTIRHLLTMSSGSPYERRFFTNGFTPFSDTWLYNFLSSYQDYAPGTRFCYNNGNVYCLSALIQKLTGKPMVEYLREKMFGPMECSDKIWWELSPEGINTGLNGLNATAEDVAKFTVLLLQRGEWEGKQLLSQAYVDDATRKHIDNSVNGVNRFAKDEVAPDSQQGYGYFFWRCQPEGSYSGFGMYGQYSIVLPEQDMTVTIISGCPNRNVLPEGPNSDLILPAVWETLLPAVDGELSGAQAAQAKLDARLAGLTIAWPEGARTAEMAAQVSSRTGGFCRRRSATARGSTMRRITTRTASAATTGCSSARFPARGAWQDGAYVLKLVFNRTTFTDTMTVTFEDTAVRMTYHRTVWAYTKGQPARSTYHLVGLEAAR